MVSNGYMFTVFILPMRNWNFVRKEEYTWWKEVFILPMRNWNWRPLTPPETERAFSSYLWGIETEVLSIQVEMVPGFHLTYEELKRDLTDEELKILLDVFILPMRNWNIISTDKYFVKRFVFISAMKSIFQSFSSK